MLTSAQEVTQFTKGMTFASFIGCPKTIKAVLFNLQVIGEAANKLPDDVKQLAPTVPWQQLRGLRNRVAHEYFDINLEMIWTVTQRHIPVLTEALHALLQQLDTETLGDDTP
jgi:uncharacterized protein with HEPN domain